MTASNQEILQTPIKDFHLGNGLDAYKRSRHLTKEGIKGILQGGPVQFLIADVGHELEIIDTNGCFKFWKAEVEKHLAHSISRFRLEDYPDEYVYIASEWVAEGRALIILLEKMH